MGEVFREDPKKGDLVVFRHDHDPERIGLGRVVGTVTDTIRGTYLVIESKGCGRLPRYPHEVAIVLAREDMKQKRLL